MWAPDAKFWNRLWSVQVAIVTAIFTGLWGALPFMQEYLKPEWFAGICLFLSIGGAFLRLLDQPEVRRQ